MKEQAFFFFTFFFHFVEGDSVKKHVYYEPFDRKEKFADTHLFTCFTFQGFESL